jgi:Ala-tRNA(Pro) deacylase
MSISNTVRNALEGGSITYELIPHQPTHSSMGSAGSAKVDCNHLAKAVIVKEDDEYMMVVVPSDYHVHLGRLHQLLGLEVGLATEGELVTIFHDCECGAIPPLGVAYRLITLVDSTLLDQDEIYFESGDHEHLIKVSGRQFSALLGDAERVNIAIHH